MWISRLSLRNYRSYPELDLEFGPGVTTFVADNGTGKTNIVEAIGYLAHLRSHRVAFDAPLVNEQASSATVSSPFKASSATFALNAGLCCLRVVIR